MANQKKKSGFMVWYESYSGKKTVNMVYSLGASVVIIGALFKILHWPGANYVLMLGMFTEAFLFAIGILEKPQFSYHWENLYPELLKEGAEGNAVVGGKAETSTGVQSLGDNDMQALQKGIGELAKTAQQLSSLSSVAESTNQLSQKLNAAGAAADQFVGAQGTLAANATALSDSYKAIAGNAATAVKDAENYGKAVAAVNAQLASLNSVYELQLKAAKAAEAQSDEYAKSVAKLTENATATLKSAEAVAKAQDTLAKQVADLNKVYGNMLNAVA